MEPRLILFDIDGTLVETGGAGRRAMESACTRVFGIDGVAARADGVRYAGMTDPVILRALAAALGIADDAFEARRPEVLRAYVQELEQVLALPEPRRRALPGVRDLLVRLQARDGVHLGLCTGNIEQGAWLKLRSVGMLPYKKIRQFDGW